MQIGGKKWVWEWEILEARTLERVTICQTKNMYYPTYLTVLEARHRRECKDNCPYQLLHSNTHKVPKNVWYVGCWGEFRYEALRLSLFQNWSFYNIITLSSYQNLACLTHHSFFLFSDFQKHNMCRFYLKNTCFTMEGLNLSSV